MATNNDYLNNFNALYDKFYAKLNTNPVEYNPPSASTLKDSLARAMRPAYDKQVQQRRETAAANRAAIDADASARGMGSSTWVTDVKNRQRDAEAKDIAGINSDYNSALYSALLNRLNAQDELSLSAQQANASARQNAQGQALSLAQGLYDKVYAPASTGGGGYGRRGSSGVDKTEGVDKLPEFGEGVQNPVSSRAIAAAAQRAKENAENAAKAKSASEKRKYSNGRYLANNKTGTIIKNRSSGNVI